MNDQLSAPCQWCGYNGTGYWQARTHKPQCPWFVMGGAAERNHILHTINDRQFEKTIDLSTMLDWPNITAGTITAGKAISRGKKKP